MSERSWRVTRDGASGMIALKADGVIVHLGAQPTMIGWDDRPTITFPTPYSVLLVTVSERFAFGFSSTADQRDFRNALSEVEQNATTAGADFVIPPSPSGPAQQLHMTTLDAIMGKAVVADHGVVTASVVMSRNLFADAGSQLKSVVGGNLRGVEKALDLALQTVRDQLSRNARAAGANAVVGVSLSLAATDGVASGGSQLVIMMGTAVTVKDEPPTAD